MIRDPRDMIISGYYYHLRTDEWWANVQLRELLPGIQDRWSLLDVERISDLSYRQYLNTLSRDEGLEVELLRFVTTVLPEMTSWEYDRPNVLELRYEESVGNDRAVFTRLFDHFGFDQAAVDKSTAIAEQFSLESQKRKGVKHIRSGKPRQWEREFTDRHTELFASLAGDALSQLGYE